MGTAVRARVMSALAVAALGAAGCGSGSDTTNASPPNATASEADPGDRTSDDPGSGDGVAEPAPSGTVVVEVAGETFTANVTACQIDDVDGALVESDGDPAIQLRLGVNPELGWQGLNAEVSVAGGASYRVSQADPDEVHYEPGKIAITSSEFFDDDFQPLGTGTVRATCA